MNDSAEIQRLEELVEKWAAEATRQSERADAAEDRVKELLEDNARGAAYVAHLKARITELGGAA